MTAGEINISLTNSDGKMLKTQKICYYKELESSKVRHFQKG